MNWKCVQTIQMIFKENILRAQKKKKKKMVMCKDGIVAEDLAGYMSIFSMMQNAEREHTRDGHVTFPARAGQGACETAVCCL